MFATCYSTVSNLRQYGQQLQNIYCYFILVFSLLIIDISLSLSSHLYLLSHLCLLYSSSIARQSPKATTWCHQSHQRPPLDVTDHLSSLFCFDFFFFFSFTDFGCGLMGGLGNGWVRMGRLVVGGFGLWAMAVGGLRWWWVDQWWWVGWLVMGESVVGELVVVDFFFF